MPTRQPDLDVRRMLLINLAIDVIEKRISTEKVVDLFERWAVPFTLPDFEDLF